MNGSAKRKKLSKKDVASEKACNERPSPHLHKKVRERDSSAARLHLDDAIVVIAGFASAQPGPEVGLIVDVALCAFAGADYCKS